MCGRKVTLKTQYRKVEGSNPMREIILYILCVQLFKAFRIKFQKFAAHAQTDVLINETFIPT